MKRLLVLTIAGVLLATGSAEAYSLSKGEATRAINRYLTWQGGNTGHAIYGCRRSGGDLRCWVDEYGVTWGDATGTLSWVVSARCDGPLVRLASPLFLLPRRGWTRCSHQ